MPKPTRHDATRRSIFRVTFTTSEGVRRTRQVRCTSWERDPQASLLGLQARLGELTLDAVIDQSSVSVPAKPRHLALDRSPFPAGTSDWRSTLPASACCSSACAATLSRSILAHSIVSPKPDATSAVSFEGFRWGFGAIR